MKNWKKQFTSLLLAIVMCLTSSIGLTAICCAAQNVQTTEVKNDLCDVQTDGEWTVHTVDGKTFLYNAYSNKKILQVFGYIENGDLVEADLVEYARLLNESAKQRKIEQELSLSGSDVDVGADENGMNSNSFYIYQFRKAGEPYNATGTPVQVSQGIRAPGKISIGYSVAITESFGGNFNFGADVKESVRVGAGFTWSTSLATTANFEEEFEATEPGVYCVEFVPIYKKIDGYLYRALTNPTTGFVGEFTLAEKTTIWGKSPIKLPNGLPQGFFQLGEMDI